MSNQDIERAIDARDTLDKIIFKNEKLGNNTGITFVVLSWFGEKKITAIKNQIKRIKKRKGSRTRIAIGKKKYLLSAIKNIWLEDGRTAPSTTDQKEEKKRVSRRSGGSKRGDTVLDNKINKTQKVLFCDLAENNKWGEVKERYLEHIAR